MSDSHESHLTTETLIAMILLILFIICGPIFEKMNFHYAHESGVVMICGILISLVVNSFDEEVSSNTKIYLKPHTKNKPFVIKPYLNYNIN
jgi:hypothetical protein